MAVQKQIVRGMLECLYLILDVDYMSRYLVSDFVETALSPLTLSIHSIFTHTALFNTHFYLSVHAHQI